MSIRNGRGRIYLVGLAFLVVLQVYVSCGLPSQSTAIPGTITLGTKEGLDNELYIDVGPGSPNDSGIGLLYKIIDNRAQYKIDEKDYQDYSDTTTDGRRIVEFLTTKGFRAVMHDDVDGLTDTMPTIAYDTHPAFFDVTTLQQGLNSSAVEGNKRIVISLAEDDLQVGLENATILVPVPLRRNSKNKDNPRFGSLGDYASGDDDLKHLTNTDELYLAFAVLTYTKRQFGAQNDIFSVPDILPEMDLFIIKE